MCVRESKFELFLLSPLSAAKHPLATWWPLSAWQSGRPCQDLSLLVLLALLCSASAAGSLCSSRSVAVVHQRLYGTVETGAARCRSASKSPINVCSCASKWIVRIESVFLQFVFFGICLLTASPRDSPKRQFWGDGARLSEGALFIHCLQPFGWLIVEQTRPQNSDRPLVDQSLRQIVCLPISWFVFPHSPEHHWLLWRVIRLLPFSLSTASPFRLMPFLKPTSLLSVGRSYGFTTFLQFCLDSLSLFLGYTSCSILQSLRNDQSVECKYLSACGPSVRQLTDRSTDAIAIFQIT